ncbi:hypothetical protein RHA1_ro03560 [Rhodococcus jostii RHA1]|uniref:Uncharacterized protein n=1 Tax=Rhodococcus jostii (strain RHA1) TaxID=101510 RepID=Q0SAS3_RHOJR|nr:hypothetical protein RHA1_ro03560 [Rhodococcus jostii RHA1]
MPSLEVFVRLHRLRVPARSAPKLPGSGCESITAPPRCPCPVDRSTGSAEASSTRAGVGGVFMLAGVPGLIDRSGADGPSKQVIDPSPTPVEPVT